jgi:hypothetical protein
VNEDERGITPANVTAITVDRPGPDWRVIIEQGNGDVIKLFELTDMERAQLGMMLESGNSYSLSFVDFSRSAAAPPSGSA